MERFCRDLPSSRLEGWVDRRAVLLGSGIVVERGARILAGAVLEAPVYVGAGAEIGPGAYLRRGTYVGAQSVVGASSGVEGSVLLPGARVGNLSFVGESVLGCGVELGVGTVISSSRLHWRGERLGSGERAVGEGFGAILGDRVGTGGGVVIEAGTVIGRESRIGPGVVVRRGIYPARTHLAPPA